MIALNGEDTTHMDVHDSDHTPGMVTLRPTRRTIWRRKHEIRAGGAPHFYTGAMTPELPPDNEVRVGYRNRTGNPGEPVEEGCEYVGFAYRAHLHFDNLPHGATIEAAHLILRVDETVWQVGGQPAGKVVSAAKALLVLEAPLQKGDAGFFTPAYTWCELPTEITGMGALGKASFALAEGLKIDVTGPVRAWVSGEAHNHGFVLMGLNEAFEHNNDVQESTYGETLLVIRLRP